MTLTVEEADFAGKVEKQLKDYRKRANVPGFRPGQVPMSLVRRQYGDAVKVDVINNILGEEIYKYVRDNKVQMLGEPVPSEKQAPVDFEKGAPYTFVFDIAVAPEFKIELNGDDKVDFYNITVDDKIIDQQVEMYASRSGHYDKVKEYQPNDMLKGDMRELDGDGNTKEGGVAVEGAIMMPEYIKVEDQKALFKDVKLGDVITFNPRKAYPEGTAEIQGMLKVTRDEAEKITADFSYQITEISRFVKAGVDKALFDQVHGEGKIADEKAFRERIAQDLKAQFATDSDFRFITDLRKHCEEKVGKLSFPDAILKRIMLKGNKDKGEDFVEKNYDSSIRELTWHLIKEQLVAANDIKIDDADIKEAAKEAARAQFAQYGMNNVPDEYLENYAADMLKKKEYVDNLVDRSIDRKLTDVLKKVVKLNEKDITLDEFNKLFQA